jgi:hypothetical protein
MGISSVFVEAHFNKVHKRDIIFTLEDQIVHLVVKKTKKLLKLEQVSNKKVTWVTRMRFEQRGYYYLEK